MSNKMPLIGMLRVELKPWEPPNFAVRADQEGSIPVAELQLATLDALAQSWLNALYTKANQPVPSITRQR